MFSEKKIKLVLFLVVLSALGNNLLGEIISLNKAVVIAQKNNQKIIQYKERLLEKKWDNIAAFGNFLPTVTMNGGVTAMKDPLVMDMDPIRNAMILLQTETLTKIAVDSLFRVTNGTIPASAIAAFKQQYGAGIQDGLERALPPFVDTLKEQQYPFANCTIMQPLFMGGRLFAAQKVAGAELQAAISELEKMSNEVIMEVVVTYETVTLLKEVVSVRRDVLDGMQHHEMNAIRLSESGTIPASNRLRAQVAVAQAKRALKEDVNRLELANLALCKVLNVSFDSLVEISDTLFCQSLNEPVEAYIKRADSLQPILSITNSRISAAEAKQMAERGNLLPKIGAFGKIELFPEYLSALEPQWVVGISMSMDIFAGGKNYSKFQSANHLVKEAKSARASVHRDIELWVRKAFLECENANNRYTELCSDEMLIRENLRQSKSRFENGYGTALEVIDAELALEKNRLEKCSALFEFSRAYIDLSISVGKPSDAIARLSSNKGGGK